MNTPIASIFDLSPSEKLQLVEDLWDDLAADPEAVPVHEWQKEKLARRKANLMQTDALRRALGDGDEFALLDVRERGQYARGPLFLAINLPLSHLELRMRRYVPRVSARILLCDAGNGLSERAAGVMEAEEDKVRD